MAQRNRWMERLNEKLIGRDEMMHGDRLTKVEETDVWLFISQSEMEKDLKGCVT